MRLEVPKPPYEQGVAEQIERWKAGSSLETPEIFEAFHIHPDLASRTGVLGAGFLGHNLMSTRDREIVIDRVTGKYGAEHEWSLFSRPLVTDELLLIEAVDELAESTDLGEESWRFLRDRYDDKQLIEFILLVGWYRTVSSLCNVLRLPAHPECRSFPSTET